MLKLNNCKLTEILLIIFFPLLSTSCSKVPYENKNREALYFFERRLESSPGIKVPLYPIELDDEHDK